jgi:GNAT superfamily N-acetyltransferase
MEIVDLTEKTLNSYLACLEDWSDDIKDAGNHKALWYGKMKDRGLRVKLAVRDGRVCGMIQYVPIEHAFAEGGDLYFIHCIWVHGHKGKGVGNMQKQGMGKALLRAAEEDVRALGRKGLVAWGLSLPFWMRASWFKNHPDGSGRRKNRGRNRTRSPSPRSATGGARRRTSFLNAPGAQPRNSGTGWSSRGWIRLTAQPIWNGELRTPCSSTGRRFGRVLRRPMRKSGRKSGQGLKENNRPRGANHAVRPSKQVSAFGLFIDSGIHPMP